MKLIKIGSSSACDIVLHSDFISAHHADITLLDNGDIILEDKNSKNGTFVRDKKIAPNQEVTIRRGDLIKFADVDLVWSRVPSLEKNTGYKLIVNIGSNFRNDIVLNNGTVSRYHATLKVKGGKAFIVDNGSTNGTKVNGIAIQNMTRITRSDNVLCGDEDITDQIRPYIPSLFPVWAQVSSAIVGVAAILALAFFFIKPYLTSVKPEQVRPTVVYVRAAFHYIVSLEDNPFINDEYSDLLIKESPLQYYQATAFFIDDEGRMATNRHVAVPWDEAYRSSAETETLKEAYQSFILKQLNVPNWDILFDNAPNYIINRLASTELGHAILCSCSDMDEIRVKLRMIENSKIVIKGEIDFITVGYPSKNYTHEDEFQRCYVLCDSENKDVDLALLQLNNKKTPEDVTAMNGVHLLDPVNVYDDEMVPLKDEFTSIGYPLGLIWGLDEQTHALEPTTRNIQCTKVPSKYTFELSADIKGGCSGSPVFDKKGRLVGVLSSVYENTSVCFAVQAKYLRQLYEKEVGDVLK